MKKGKWGIIALSIAMLIVGIFIGNMFSDSFTIGDKNSLKGNIGELATGPSTPDRCIPESNSAFCLRLGKNCGKVIANDNCGVLRTAICGNCSVGQTCLNGKCGGIYISAQAISSVPNFLQACSEAAEIINNPGYRLIINGSGGLPIDLPPPIRDQFCSNKCGDGTCQNAVCFGSGCTCVENTNSCPSDCTPATPPNRVCADKCGDGTCQQVSCVGCSETSCCPCIENMNSCPNDCTPTTPPPICVNKCGDGTCQEVVCFGSGCTCAESINNCPADCTPPATPSCVDKCGDGICTRFNLCFFGSGCCSGNNCPCLESYPRCWECAFTGVPDNNFITF